MGSGSRVVGPRVIHMGDITEEVLSGVKRGVALRGIAINGYLRRPYDFNLVLLKSAPLLQMGAFLKDLTMLYGSFGFSNLEANIIVQAS
jgi:hypothetical protein